MNGRSMNNGNGETVAGLGGPTRDWQQEIARRSQEHWWRRV